MSKRSFDELVALMTKLRGPDGCPWDREQTLETMTPYLTEEAVESAEAIAGGKDDDIAEELGDLAFLAIFCLEQLSDRGKLTLADGLNRAADKLIRRHPHVYGDTQISNGDAAYRQWQETKQGEKGGKGSLLGEQPRGLPALVGAYRVQEKAAAVGFDWPSPDGPLRKVREELDEIAEAVERDTTPEQAREIGDLLFASVNLARHLRVDPERELRAAMHRFRDRFHHIERRLAEQGRRPSDAALEELDELWEEAKRLPEKPAAHPEPRP